MTLLQGGHWPWCRPLARCLIALIGTLLLLAGCGVSTEEQTPPIAASYVGIAAPQSLGQTFVSGADGLRGIALDLRPLSPGSGEIRVILRDIPESPMDLAVATLPISAVTTPGWYPFDFGLTMRSHQRRFYVIVEVRGAGAVQVAVAPPGAYLNGSLYADGRPAEGQLVHQLHFSVPERLLGAGVKLAGWLLKALAMGFLLLPGLALALLASGPRRIPLAELIILGMGVGTALAPILVLWVALAGLRAGALLAWLPGLVAAAYLGWRTARWWPRRQALRPAPSDLALLLIAVALSYVRLLVIDPLDGPLWGDSVQHAVMAQLFLDHGGLFQSWEPYAPYGTLTMQYGFSAIVALYSQITGADVMQATLAVGQLLNVAAALSLYPITVRVSGGNRWAGVGAVLIAGLIAPLPGGYVSWGRYAQLTGQAVLPAALLLTWDLIGADRLDWRRALLLGLAVSGMALSYYRMAFFFGLFALVLLAAHGLPSWGRAGRRWLLGLGGLALGALVAGLLFLPWARNVAGSSIAGNIVEGVVTASPLDYVRSDYRIWLSVDSYFPPALIGLLIFGLALAIALSRWAVAGVGLWFMLLALYPAGQLFNLPGAVMLQSFAVLIALYLPTAIIGGWMIGLGLEQRRPAVRLALAALLALAGLWGFTYQRQQIDPRGIMVARPDTRAMAWIAWNTPPDAVFLVQGYRVYGGTTAVGADAGWWLPLLAGRANTMPPQYALANEVPIRPGYSQAVVDLVAALEQHRLDSPEALRSLCAFGVTHAYIGQGQGLVGLGARQLFSPDELRASPYFDLIYAQDRVLIFELDKVRFCPAG